MSKLVLPGDNRASHSGEVCKVRWDVIRFLIGAGFDLGPGRFKVSQNAVGIDTDTTAGVQANLIHDARDLAKYADGEWDFVFSSFLLHLLPEWERSLRDWWRVIRPGGHLVLYVPDPGLAGYGVPLPELEALIQRLRGGWDELVNERRSDADEYGRLLVYRKRNDGKKTHAAPHVNENTCAVIRYGGIGDHIMTASVLPELKREGWHVVYVTNQAGEEVVRHDPHIDEVWTDTANLTPEEMGAYWQWIGQKFPKCINMMNSVENFALPQPSQGNYHISETGRRALYGSVSYLMAQHLQAEVNLSGTPQAKWYALPSEQKWAQKERTALVKGTEAPILVLWALAGSAVHKQSPFAGKAIQSVLEALPSAVIVTTGSKAQAEFQGLPDHPRHIRKAGQWTVRQSLAMAQAADVVVGPETGVLNAVGMEDVAKVVWLSHSSAENLCDFWQGPVLAVTPDPDIAPCHPCHRLHWGWQYCHQHPESKASLCVHGISPKRMAEAVLEAVEMGKAQAAA